MSDISHLLDAAVGGDPTAAADLLPLVYDELRRLAAARMVGEAADHTLQPTALVHEAYLRLVGDQQFNGRGHFFAAAVTDSLLALNQAIGGAGAAGDGARLGGGVFNGPPTPFGVPSLTIESSLVALNRATGGASTGGVAGSGVGGGLYLAPGSAASGALTAVVANDASTSADDVFGILV
jgi:hypothetical protein